MNIVDVTSRGFPALVALATCALALLVACSSATPTPTATPEPTATPTPAPEPTTSGGGDGEGGESATPGPDLSAIADPTDIAQLPADVRELATCMKATLGEPRFNQVITQIFARDYIPLSIDLPLIDACGVTLRDMQDLGALFGLGR